MRVDEMTELRDFQKLTKDNLLKGNSTIVVAPTGLGKTRAALLPFYKSCSKLGTRIIYALPIRALAKGVQAVSYTHLTLPTN